MEPPRFGQPAQAGPLPWYLDPKEVIEISSDEDGSKEDVALQESNQPSHSAELILNLWNHTVDNRRRLLRELDTILDEMQAITDYASHLYPDLKLDYF